MTPWPDRAIAEIAARQRTMVTRGQLVALGLAPRTVEAALARGRLHRVHHGVYSLVAPAVRPPFAAEGAALLACGPSARLSHHSAAGLHGLRLPVRVDGVHVTTTTAHARRHRGVVTHRTTRMAAADRMSIAHLPVTGVARTLVDLSPHLPDAMLEPLVDQALRRTSRTKLLEACGRHRGAPGVARLRALLDPKRPSAETWSHQEARLRAAILRAGLPAPECNVAIGAYVADMLWREQRVIVEYDSYAFHHGPGVFHRDRTRHNDLAVLDGFQVIHVTGRQLARELERVIVWIALALHDGGAGLR